MGKRLLGGKLNEKKSHADATTGGEGDMGLFVASFRQHFERHKENCHTFL